MPFPLTRDIFYSFFLGKYVKPGEEAREARAEVRADVLSTIAAADYSSSLSAPEAPAEAPTEAPEEREAAEREAEALEAAEEPEQCMRVKKKNFITPDSCLINSDLLKVLASGYVSYFRGGNPNAYPYKRIITLEHKMSATQKESYINALKSDVSKDPSRFSQFLNEDDMIFKRNDFDFKQKEDSVSGIYVTTQQFSNISLPISKSDIIDNMLSQKGQSTIKTGFKTFETELKQLRGNPETVLNYIREKGYSQKFVSIITLSLQCNGPVFIFSNWLQFGVKSLATILDACGFVKYPAEGIHRYFIWSGDTSNDKELTNRAKNEFNSVDNKDGALLKIILGTRSIMEGVSFKNIKQVHITDPWWNEARIEQNFSTSSQVL